MVVYNKPNIIIGVYNKHPPKNSLITYKICLVASGFNYDILKYEHNQVIGGQVYLTTFP